MALAAAVDRGDQRLRQITMAPSIIRVRQALLARRGMESSWYDEQQKRNRSGFGVVSWVEPNNPSSPQDYGCFEGSGTFCLNFV